MDRYIVGWTDCFFFLFECFPATWEYFTHIETSSWLLTFTYTRYLWSLSSEGFSTCHSYCDTGQPFIIVISEEPDTHTFWLFIYLGQCLTVFIYMLSESSDGNGLATVGTYHYKILIINKFGIRHFEIHIISSLR